MLEAHETIGRRGKAEAIRSSLHSDCVSGDVFNYRECVGFWSSTQPPLAIRDNASAHTPIKPCLPSMMNC